MPEVDTSAGPHAGSSSGRVPYAIFLLPIVVVLITLLPAPTVFGEQRPDRVARPTETAVAYAKRALQGFDMRVWISNQMTIGSQAWDGIYGPPTDLIGLEYPYGSRVEHVYGGGPMLGGIVNGVRKVARGYDGDTGEKYLRPDPRHPLRELIWRTSVGDSLTEPNRRGCDDDGDGLVDEDDLDGLDNDGDWNAAADDVGSDGIADALEVGCRGGYDAVDNPDPAFDDFDSTKTDFCHPDATGSYRKKDDPDAYTENNGVPDHGEPHVDEDYAALSDNDLYCSATDTADQPAGRISMGIKVLQRSYAWKDPAYGAVIPMEYRFVNIGDKPVDQAYVGFFMDADVGPVDAVQYYTKNYACLFDTLRTAYVHNPVDRGSTPVGLAVLKTPRPLNELRYIFQWFDFTTNPSPGSIDSILYGWMSGEPFPDNPVAICGSPTDPGDVRFLFSFGPFETFAPGETLSVTFALLSGTSVESGRNSLKENAVKALHLTDLMADPGVPLPRPVPPAPQVRATKSDQTVRLEWGPSSGGEDPFAFWDVTNRFAETFPDDHWRRIDAPCAPAGSGGAGWCGPAPPCDSAGGLPGGRAFEGYRLYRSESQDDAPLESSFSLVREYDIPDDGVGFDFGLDTVFVDSTLRTGYRYWYSVTAFTIPDLTVVSRPSSTGEILYDSIFTPGIESSILSSMVSVNVSFRASNGPGRVRVVPNPYRVDEEYTTEAGGWEGSSNDWTDFKRKIRFIHLPRRCTIRIFTVAGDIVAGMEYESPPEDPDEGYLDWRLVTPTGRPLASGVYVFTVDSEYGTQYGKFVVIR